MESRRIVMASTFYPPYHLGGDAVHVRYLAEELVRRGHEVHVLHSLDAFALKARGKEPKPVRSDVHTHPVSTSLGATSASMAYVLGTNGAAERELERLVQEVKPDWIHHHNISLLGQQVLSIGDAPKMYTAHDHWLACPAPTWPTSAGLAAPRTGAPIARSAPAGRRSGGGAAASANVS